MASFTTTLTIMLWKCVRAPPDRDGGKGYNVYEASFSLHGSEMVTNVAHMTLQAPYYPGTIARVSAEANLHEGSLLLVAFRLIPAPVQPIVGVQPQLFHLLPRVNVTGVVASVDGPSALNSNSLEFTVTVYRKDIFPVQELLLACVANRDDDRLTFHERLVVDMPVKFSGVICGWSRHGTLLIDVYTLEKNYTGPASPVWTFDRPNPFEHAVFIDSYARFPAARSSLPRRALGYDILSHSAPRTRITRRYNRTPDPRLRAGPTPDVTTPPVDAMAVDSSPGTVAAAVEHRKELVNLVSGWPLKRPRSPALQESRSSPSLDAANESDCNTDDNISSTAVIGDGVAGLGSVDSAEDEGVTSARGSSSALHAAGTAAWTSSQASPGSPASHARDVEAFLSVQDARDAVEDESHAVRGTKRRRKTSSLVSPRKVILRLPNLDVAA